MKIETILNRLLAIQTKMADLKKEQDDLKNQADKQIGDTNRLDVSGYAFIREFRQTKKYSMPELRRVIKDQDILESCLIPDSAKVKKALKQIKATKEQIAQLEQTMEVTGESISVKLLKVKTTI